MVDWLNELREGIFEAYSGIIQGLKGDETGQNAGSLILLEPHIHIMAQFISCVSRDVNNQDKVLAGAAGLVG